MSKTRKHSYGIGIHAELASQNQQEQFENDLLVLIEQLQKHYNKHKKNNITISGVKDGIYKLQSIEDGKA